MNNGRLVYVSPTVVRLVPIDGNRLLVNSQIVTIPSAGVDLAPTALPLVDHFIYAYMNISTLTLEASVTPYVMHPAYGIAVKSGDFSRTLVGGARPETGPVWVRNGTNKCLVASWANRRAMSVYVMDDVVPADVTVGTSWTNITGYIMSLWSWNDDIIEATMTADLSGNYGSTFSAGFSVDGVLPSNREQSNTTTYDAGIMRTVNVRPKLLLPVGSHVLQMVGILSSVSCAVSKQSGCAAMFMG